MRKNPSLVIAAGKGCFTCCKGCYQYFGKNLIPTNDLLDFVAKYKKEFGLEKITLAGGDPMTRRDIVFLVDELIKIGLKVSMDTVGKNFVRDSKIVFNDIGISKFISPCDLEGKLIKIGIPVDGCTTEQCNYFRKMITIEEIEEILTVLDNYNYNICINTVVNKQNINDLNSIYDIVSKYDNVTQWQLFQYSPIGDLGYKNRQLYEISDEDFIRNISNLLRYANKSKITIEGKTNSYRKLNYILVNSDGEVWQPQYDLNTIDFKRDDANSDKTIIGTIYDEDIIEKIKKYLNSINNNIVMERG